MAVTVKGNEPGVVGVPVSWPVWGLSVSPVGNEPPVTAQAAPVEVGVAMSVWL